MILMDKTILIKEKIPKPKYSPKEWDILQKNILKTFFTKKEDLYRSLEYGKLFMLHYLSLIQNIADKTYKNIFKNENPKEIAIFPFGSSSRYEMLGQPDLDILIVREKDIYKFNLFRKKFIQKIKKYNFNKIDIPY